MLNSFKIEAVISYALHAVMVLVALLVVCIAMPSCRGLLRWNEKLPSITVKDDIVYCRMSYCDFDFPLPNRVSVLRIDGVRGSVDTVEGMLHLVSLDANHIDIADYENRLKRSHFVVENNSSSSSGVINGLYAHSTSPKGCSLEVKSEGKGVTIHLSYFGDY